MAKQYDVIVIGGGAVGLACAYFLNRAGRSVCILERGEPGSGASHGNAGLITPSHALPLCHRGALTVAAKSLFNKAAPLALRPSAIPGMAGWLLRFARNCNDGTTRRIMAARVPLLQSSRELTEKLVKLEDLHCEWAPTGVLGVCKTARGLEGLQRFAAAAAEHGIETELIEAAALLRREPALQDDLAGGVLFPGDGKLQPAEFVSELARVCRDKGVVIEPGRQVETLNIEHGKVHSAYTDPGVHRADQFVLASGVWSAPLAKQFGMSLPIQPGKGYSITARAPDLCPKRGLLLEERSIAVTPWANQYRLAGTMEFAGFDDRPNQARQGALIDGAAEYLREPIGRGEQEIWNGFRPMTPDDLPLIGAAPAIDGLTLACGHNMMGISMALGTGRLVAELITDSKTHIDQRPFDPARFGRLRSVNPVELVRRALAGRLTRQ